MGVPRTAVALTLLLCGAAWAQDAPERRDARGDPLPEHAVSAEVHQQLPVAGDVVLDPLEDREQVAHVDGGREPEHREPALLEHRGHADRVASAVGQRRHAVAAVAGNAHDDGDALGSRGQLSAKGA